MSAIQQLNQMKTLAQDKRAEAEMYRRDAEKSLENAEAREDEAETLEKATNIIEEFRSEEQEAFNTLCVQSAAGEVTTADLISYASLRELTHPEPPPDQESETPALQKTG